jgi:hypothetical protein
MLLRKLLGVTCATPEGIDVPSIGSNRRTPDMDYKREIVETSLKVPECFGDGCHEDAAYEGWARVIDPCIGQTSGRMIFVPVCEEHKVSLIGFQEGKEPENGTNSS